MVLSEDGPAGKKRVGEWIHLFCNQIVLPSVICSLSRWPCGLWPTAAAA